VDLREDKGKGIRGAMQQQQYFVIRKEMKDEAEAQGAITPWKLRAAAMKEKKEGRKGAKERGR
jgi:hypothetical protein